MVPWHVDDAVLSAWSSCHHAPPRAPQVPATCARRRTRPTALAAPRMSTVLAGAARGGHGSSIPLDRAQTRIARSAAAGRGGAGVLPGVVPPRVRHPLRHRGFVPMRGPEWGAVRRQRRVELQRLRPRRWRDR
eukprot:CAMPEP_0180156588 /NCGR_PEP_ID=MMETSP0986-20121125/25665_1 /TAXON_ID=697907 /ORGANISM="non described non described, Strain CCMP2293" /LENGTH=132 /DNA_ID=CAMNT_0022105805 /DNA_START=295 /DNA_END=694 /DNA_ORIENTATION=-